MTDIVTHNDPIATIGMDLGKRSFHLIGMDARGKVIMRQQLSRGRLERHMANLQPCLVGIEACAGAHHIGRRLSAFGHNVRLIPGQYVKPFRKGQKNDYRDAEAIAEAVQRPTMRFVPIKSAEQLDLQALHRIRSRLVGHRTAVINQLRSFLLECGVIVPQGPARLREILPSVLAQRTDVLSPRMIRLIEELADDWRRLDDRVDAVTSEVQALARQGRMLSAADERSGDRSSDGQRSGGHDWEWRGLQQGARLWSLARAGAEATLHRRQNDTRPTQQTRQQVRAHAIHHRGSRRAGKARQLGEVWAPRMAGSCRQAPPP
jgi:transposase